MKKLDNDPEQLLKSRSTRKWMLQCVGCSRWGYRHDAPPHFFNRVYLEKNFEVFKLDESGLCQQCHESASVKPPSNAAGSS